VALLVALVVVGTRARGPGVSAPVASAGRASATTPPADAQPPAAVPPSAVASTAEESGPTREVTLEIGGMVCPACSLKVTSSLIRVQGVRAVDLSLAKQRAIVRCGTGVADSALTQAVRAAGPEYVGLVVRK
jgi:copper chaperone CopZ